MTLFKNRALFFIVVVMGVSFTKSIGALEQPAYDLVEEIGELQIRRYRPVIVARTLVDEPLNEAGNEGFRRLAGYIFGGNMNDQKIAMTAPVGLSSVDSATSYNKAGSDRYWITFSMPSQYDIAGLPKPDDSRVELVQKPERFVAVVRYRGSWAQSRYLTHEARLLTLVEQLSTWTKKGEVTWARYNPPFVPGFFKTNEVAVEIVPASKSSGSD